MDPVTALGLVATAGKLVTLCFNASDSIHSIHTRQGRAADSLLATKRECTMLGAAAEGIKAWAETPAARSSARSSQCVALDAALKSLIPSVQVLVERVDGILRRSADGSLGVRGKIKYLWREEEIKAHLEEIIWQSQHIHVLLSTISLPATQAVTEVHRLNDVASEHYSMDEDDQSILTATDFDFDSQILNSAVYRRAFIAARRGKTIPPQPQQELKQPLPALQEGEESITLSEPTLTDVPTGRLLRTLEGHLGSVKAVAFSPDGRRLASASEDKTVRLWDSDSGQCLLTLEGHSNWVCGVAFSPDGKQLASASRDSTLRLWDVRSGQLLQTLAGISDVWAVAFSPDGKQLASSEKVVRLWDSGSGRLLHTLEGHSDCVWSVAFSPNGERLVSASYDKTVRLWDCNSGRLLRTLGSHFTFLYGVAFSPDGKKLALGSYKLVPLWDSDSGQQLQLFEGHSNWVWAVAFSPEGKRLASGSEDKTVRLWNSDTGQCLQTFEGHLNPIRAVAFSPDGRRLASASEDKTVRLWDACISNH